MQMPRIVITVFLFLSFFCANAQDKEYVIFRNDKWVIPHSVQQGETLFQLARRYHVPPAMLADANGLDYQDGLKRDSIVYIPVGAYNQLSREPANLDDSRRLYYRVGDHDNLFRISRYAGVSQKQVQEWNSLPDNSISEGQELMVGWLLYDATQNPVYTTPGKTEAPVSKTPANTVNTQKGITKLPDGTTIIPVKDTTQEDTLSEIEKEYLAQTNNDINVFEEKGMAVFFDMSGVSFKGVYYGFHNTAGKGTIIKVYNPGTDKTVYVKIIGPVPGTKQYYNSIMGISGAAKKELQVRENKMWAELRYKP